MKIFSVKIFSMKIRAVLLLVTVALCAPLAAAQGVAERFDKREAMVAMRDGVKLYTTVYAPKSATVPLPILFLRTPYGIDGAAGRIASSLKELADDGYIFAFQDARGKFRSEGEFVMQRPPRADAKNAKAIDEGTDAYDSIDWLIKTVSNNNGRVGMLGVSYDGWLTMMALIEPHPALRAASPQASPADMFLGDDFHHNGAFRLSYGFEYAAMMEAAKGVEQFKFDRYDTYDWYLNLGSLANVNERYLKGKIPTWNDYVNHPNYDAFWQRQAAAQYLKQVRVPTLNVAGWWDQEDFYGPLKIYAEFEKQDAKRQNYLVVGPWNHGGWNRSSGDQLGRIKFGAPTSKYYREQIQAPFFAHFLKDKGRFAYSEAVTFQTGSNEWKTYDEFPPRKRATVRPLYFHADGRLSFDAPAPSDARGFDSYVSDPANPVPYRPRPIEPTYFPAGSGWSTWLLEDQRFVHRRPDVLSWETDVLTEDVTVTGEIIAHLFASTTGSDSDWVVKLIDVYPEENRPEIKMSGYQLMIANEVFRGRFRRSFEKPEAIVPNQVNEYPIDLHWIDHRFLKGHKIMVQVQSTWFPIIDRNPQKFVANIFLAKEADYQKATQRIFRSRRFPSHLKLPIMK